MTLLDQKHNIIFNTSDTSDTSDTSEILTPASESLESEQVSQNTTFENPTDGKSLSPERFVQSSSLSLSIPHVSRGTPVVLQIIFYVAIFVAISAAFSSFLAKGKQLREKFLDLNQESKVDEISAKKKLSEDILASTHIIAEYNSKRLTDGQVRLLLKKLYFSSEEIDKVLKNKN